MAKYFLDDQVFDNHSDYAKAVRAKNKQLKEEQTKKIQEDLRKSKKIWRRISITSNHKIWMNKRRL